MQWEYRVYQFSMSQEPGEVVGQVLNGFGAEGWELVSVAYSENGEFVLSAIFKRPRGGGGRQWHT